MSRFYVVEQKGAHDVQWRRTHVTADVSEAVDVAKGTERMDGKPTRAVRIDTDAMQIDVVWEGVRE